MKKILLSLGTVVALATPVVSLISCGTTSETKGPGFPFAFDDESFAPGTWQNVSVKYTFPNPTDPDNTGKFEAGFIVQDMKEGRRQLSEKLAQYLNTLHWEWLNGHIWSYSLDEVLASPSDHEINHFQMVSVPESDGVPIEVFFEVA